MKKFATVMFSLVLTIAMVLCLIPATAFAAEGNGDVTILPVIDDGDITIQPVEPNLFVAHETVITAIYNAVQNGDGYVSVDDMDTIKYWLSYQTPVFHRTSDSGVVYDDYDVIFGWLRIMVLTQGDTTRYFAYGFTGQDDSGWLTGGFVCELLVDFPVIAL